MAYFIRWNKEDEASLKKAVSEFNKELAKLDNEQRKFLKEVELTDIKQSITTRADLNRTIRDLKRLSKDNQVDLIELQSGEKITRYQLNKLNRDLKRANANIQNEMIRLSQKKPTRESNKRLGELEATLKSFDTIKSKKGYDLRSTIERVSRYAGSDIEMYRANIFKNNFLEALEELEMFENYELLRNKINKMNPKKVFDYLSKSPTLMDMFNWYQSKASSYGFGDTTNPRTGRRFKNNRSQNEYYFDEALKDLGLLD